ncbi:MAG: aldolase, partial [Mesorhizobium sp.]
DLKIVLSKSAAMLKAGAKGLVYGRNVYQHANPKAVVSALMALIHNEASGEEAWDIYNRG